MRTPTRDSSHSPARSAAWDGQPVAWLLVRNESATVRALTTSANEPTPLSVRGLCAPCSLLVLGAARSCAGSAGRCGSFPRRWKTERTWRPSNKLRGDHSEFGNGWASSSTSSSTRKKTSSPRSPSARLTQEALRQSGEQLRQAQKMEAVGRLAGGVAHDFNNLLTAILGYSELLAARGDLDPFRPPERRDDPEGRAAGGGGDAPTPRLQPQADSPAARHRPQRAGDLDFEKILRRVIGEHIELCTRATAENGRVRADPNQIEQVILNLGVNARDAMMPAGGRLTIRTANVEVRRRRPARRARPGPRGGAVRAAGGVRHGLRHGRGSKIAHLRAVFHDQGAGQGHGAGLSTVYGVVKQSGGTVMVDSAPGAGCTFRVYLPLEMGELEEARPKTVAPAQNAHAARGDGARRRGRGNRARTGVRGVEGQRLRRALRANGMEALQMSEAHEGKITLMITDVVMPQLGGLELARRLAALRPETKVLYVSGYSEDDMSEQGVVLGGPGISGKAVHAAGAHAQGARGVTSRLAAGLGRRGFFRQGRPLRSGEVKLQRRRSIVPIPFRPVGISMRRRRPATRADCAGSGASTRSRAPPSRWRPPPPPGRLRRRCRTSRWTPSATQEGERDLVRRARSIAAACARPGRGNDRRQRHAAAEQLRTRPAARRQARREPVVVRITDSRRAQARAALIDLSHAAAEALGIIKSGTGPGARGNAGTQERQHGQARREERRARLPPADHNGKPAASQQAEKDAANAKTGRP